MQQYKLGVVCNVFLTPKYLGMIYLLKYLVNLSVAMQDDQSATSYLFKVDCVKLTSSISFSIKTIFPSI